MRVLLFSAFSVIVITSTAFARIGETPEQCDQRYGKPTLTEKEKDGTQLRQYAVNGYSVEIIFLSVSNKPTACSITYKKPADIGEYQLGNDDINRFLDSNSSGKTWEKVGETALQITWTLNFDGRGAALTHFGRSLSVWNARMQKMIDQKSKQDLSVF